jgi:hypothetical protein
MAAGFDCGVNGLNGDLCGRQIPPHDNVKMFNLPKARHVWFQLVCYVGRQLVLRPLEAYYASDQEGIAKI